ncbi:MAG: HPF/RaiA family ribosome-associated protein [Treponemataceae bacterium]
MNLDINAVNFNLPEDDLEFLKKKFERISYAEDLITKVNCTVKEDKKYIYDCTVSFRWGNLAHVTTENYDFKAGVNKLMDILNGKIKKEKEKIQNR